MSSRLKLVIGSAFGLGLSPVAPGTCGALLGVLIHILIVKCLPINILQTIALILAFSLVFFANHLLTPWAVEYWHSKDPKHFVLDEIAGYLIVPIFFHHGTLWQIIIWGFILFRIFDIIKLPGARQIDRRMNGAWGIILDDIVSGFYAVIFMFILKWISIPLEFTIFM